MKNIKIYRKTILVIGILLTFLPADIFSKENNKPLWHVKLAGGYVHTIDPYGISVGASCSQLFNIHMLTLRFVHINDIKSFNTTPDRYANDISLLYGLCWSPTLFGVERKDKSPLWISSALSASVGVSAIFGVTNGTFISSGYGNNYTADHFITAGFPFQIDLYLVPHHLFGFGISGLGNINAKEKYFSAWAGILIGNLRK